jgi:hypothetical protein
MKFLFYFLILFLYPIQRNNLIWYATNSLYKQPKWKWDFIYNQNHHASDQKIDQLIYNFIFNQKICISNTDCDYFLNIKLVWKAIEWLYMFTFATKIKFTHASPILANFRIYIKETNFSRILQIVLLSHSENSPKTNCCVQLAFNLCMQLKVL